jgi:tRNA threonylcarbamoyladenosine biosynthesis protein TsaB
MKILSINTSHGICSVALSENNQVICTKTDSEPSRQAERLFLTIDTMLKEANLSYADINAVAADIGPGSFTGIRIGLAAARGIAMAANIPVLGVTGFEALAQQASNDGITGKLLVALDARRGQVFVQCFCNGNAGEQALLEYSDISSVLLHKDDVVVMGDGAHHLEQPLKENGVTYSIIGKYPIPTAGMISLCAFYKLKSGDYDSNPSPLYIRAPDAKLPKNLSGI